MSDRRKLSRLYVEGFKKLTFLDIAIGDHVTEISGKNGSGKSTTFHAIDVLLDGMKAAPAVPINKDADRSIIRGTLGDLIVERTFRRTPDGAKVLSDITLRTPEGAKFPSPQRHLDEIKGAHILDPVELIERLKKSPVDVLRQFVDVDFDAIDRANLGDYDRRTEVNRFAKEARAAASLIVVPDGTPDEPVDDAALVDELQRANDHNARLERMARERDQDVARIMRRREDAERQRAEAADLRRQAEELEKRADAAESEAIKLKEQYDAAPLLPASMDLAEIRTRINGAKAVNAAVAKRAEKGKHEHIAIKYERESKELSERIDGRTEQKRNAIAEANFPIAGIGLSQGVFTLNDLPFEQASKGEQLRTAFAFIVASDPEAQLRLAWIHDAAVLDDDTLEVIGKLSAEFDVQVLLETVRPNSASAIILEDGHVKGVEPPAPKPADEPPPFDLSSTPAEPRKSKRQWRGPGAPTGEQP